MRLVGWLIAAIIVIVIIIIGVAIKIYYDYYHRRVRTRLRAQLDFIEKVNDSIELDSANVDIPVYYINLARCPDRNEFMLKQLQKFGITQYKRIEGVDGKDDPSINYINEYSGLKTMTNGEIGCTLSHLRAVKTAYDDGVEYALMLEDDTSFNFVPHWDKSLRGYIEVIKEPWHILQLYAEFDYSQLSSTYHCPRGNAQTTLAYVINRAGMKRILDQVIIDRTYYLSPALAPRGPADYFIYHMAGADRRYLINPPLFAPNNLELDSTIHTDHTNAHLRQSLGVAEIYFDKIMNNPQFHNLKLFNKLAQPRLVYDAKENPTKVDIVLAYYRHDLTWFLDMLSYLNRSNYRLFIYSKGGIIMPEKYRRYVHRWVMLDNIGRCDHTYVFHLLNVADKSDKTFLVKDSGCRHMNPTWLVENLANKCVSGPHAFPAAMSLPNFQLYNYETGHDQNRGDPYIRAPLSCLGFNNWCKFVYGKSFRCIDISKIIYGGVILCKSPVIPEKILLRAGLSLSYASNIETGHYMERLWAYLLF